MLDLGGNVTSVILLFYNSKESCFYESKQHSHLRCVVLCVGESHVAQAGLGLPLVPHPRWHWVVCALYTLDCGYDVTV